MHGALVLLTTPQDVDNSYYSAIYKYLVYGNTPFYDTDGFFNAAQPDRLTIPDAFDGAWVRVHTSVRWSAAEGYRAQIVPTYFNKATNTDSITAYPACDPDNRPAIGATTLDHGSITHPMQVGKGDYFRSAAWQCSYAIPPSGGGANDKLPKRTVMAGSFSIEVIG